MNQSSEAKACAQTELVKLLGDIQQWEHAVSIIKHMEDDDRWRTCALRELGKSLIHVRSWERIADLLQPLTTQEWKVIVLIELGKTLLSMGQQDFVAVIWDKATELAYATYSSTDVKPNLNVLKTPVSLMQDAA